VDELAPSGTAYTYTLLNKWEQVIELAETFRQNLLYNREDQHTQIEYISKLTRLWLELLPKVDGRDEFGDLEQVFMDFERYYKDPTLLLQPDYADDILKLEMLIRRILERLGITRFEGKT